MKKLTLFVLLLFNLFIYSSIAQINSLEQSINFASIEAAKKFFSTEDEYTKCWSKFDIESRMHKKNATKGELIEYQSAQALDWNTDDKRTIIEIVKGIDSLITQLGLHLDLPTAITLIKSTGNEEGGAMGYTRSNSIVLKQDFLSMPPITIKQILLHELFHILTRDNSKFRKDMYRIIGFEMMNTVHYPEALKDYRISNPDAIRTDSYITLRKDDGAVDCMMIMYSTNDYTKGEFFEYLNIGFLKLKGLMTKEVDYQDGKPIIYTFQEISNFIEQIGMNTEYILDPEEILADNFSYAVMNKKDLPSQWIIDKILDQLKK